MSSPPVPSWRKQRVPEPQGYQVLDHLLTQVVVDSTINQSINKLIDRSTNQSIHDSIDQSIHSFIQSSHPTKQINPSIHSRFGDYFYCYISIIF